MPCSRRKPNSLDFRREEKTKQIASIEVDQPRLVHHIKYKKSVNMQKIPAMTVKSRAVDRSTIQFWILLAKGHST